jgi:hypothetical protein
MKPSRTVIYVFLGSLLVFLVGIGYLLLYLTGASYHEAQMRTPEANITVLPPVTVPTIDNSYLVIEPTPTATPGQSAGGQFPLDSYVQITGTGGNGLRLRANPGTGSSVNFVAAESEVFKVVGGPEPLGEYEWWQLVAPYDSSRTGWAAGDYLTAIVP